MSLTKKQLKHRRDKIGGSDAAAICGKDPHKTAYAVAMRILGRVKSDQLDGLDHIEFGNEMEAVLARFYERKEKTKVYTPQTLAHQQHPFLIVNIDRIRKDRMDVGIECKNTGLFQSGEVTEQWGKPGTDEVPARVNIQCQHAMLVQPVFTTFHVLRCYGGNTYQKFVVPRNDRLIESLLSIELDFMADLQKGILPEPDWGHTSTSEVLRKAFTTINGEILPASEEVGGWTAAWQVCSAERLRLEKEEKALKNHIVHAMANAAALKLPDGRLWRRKEVHRDGFTVEPTDYIETRLVKG